MIGDRRALGSDRRAVIGDRRALGLGRVASNSTTHTEDIQKEY